MISPRRARRMQKIMQRKLMHDLREKTKNMLKPKPRFMPDWLWRKLIFMLLDLPQE